MIVLNERETFVIHTVGRLLEQQNERIERLEQQANPLAAFDTLTDSELTRENEALAERNAFLESRVLYLEARVRFLEEGMMDRHNVRLVELERERKATVQARIDLGGVS